MRALIWPGAVIQGTAAVPGDKSIAHRHLILASTAVGRSQLHGLPPSLDVVATARCMAALSPLARPSLETWASNAAAGAEHHGFTWDFMVAGPEGSTLLVESEGRAGLRQAPAELDCGNSGTTMRLVCGIVAASPFVSTLTGDQSLSSRPMERVAAPLRRMGADVRTTDGRPPVRVSGTSLHGIAHTAEVPSAQVKSCVLLAGISAEGDTVIMEPVATRDHTERALFALGAPISVEEGAIRVAAFQHEGFRATVPGDVSSAAYLMTAAVLTGGELRIEGVGLNETRTRFLQVMERMGVGVQLEVTGEELGEPFGEVGVRPVSRLVGTIVGSDELPLVIDEVPVLAALAAHAHGETRFEGAGELRVKESDRLAGLAEGVRGLGGHAGVEGDDLVVAGPGLSGGNADARGDHRLAMALTVASLAATGACSVEGVEAAGVSFPGFVPMLHGLGARIEV